MPRKPCLKALFVPLLLAFAVAVSCSPRSTDSQPAPGPASTSAPGPAAKGSLALSFAGKTVTIVVPMAPGGSTDILSRVYARHLGQFLPGKPNIIVRNMPGGDGVVGGNYVYFAKPDGLTLLTSTGSVAIADLLGSSALKFKLAELTAMLAIPRGAAYLFRPGIFDKPEDIVKSKKTTFGSAGFAGTSIMFLTAKDFIGIPMEKIVPAYSSGGEARRAFLSGEVDSYHESGPGYAESMRPYVEKGEAKFLFQTGIVDEKGDLVKDGIFPADVMTAKELYEKIHGKPISGAAWEAYRAVNATVQSLDKPLLLPPKTPDNIVNAYLDAAVKMINSPTFLKDSDELVGKGARWMAGEDFSKLYKKEFGIKPEIRDWLKNLLKQYGWVAE